MPRSEENKTPTLQVLALFLLTVALLYVAQDVLLPFVLAVLLGFLLTPMAARLERLRIGALGLGRIGSVILVVLFALAIVGLFAWIVVDQTTRLAADLPQYKGTLISRIEAIREQFTGPSPLADTVEELGEVISGEAEEQARPQIQRAEEPVPVQIVESSPFALRMLRDWLGPLLGPLGTAAVVIVFAIFILLQREDLRDRFVRLVGTGHVYLTTQAMDEAAERVSTYLRMLVIINGSYGLAVAIGLLLIGVPNALLWGLLAAVFRFVPYVGPWAAALLPIALSLAIERGWATPLLTIGLFLVLELVSNNVLEPWLYGTKTGVSVVGIIFAATFWTWLWGPVGLVLSMPLTVCLTVIGRFVPQLSFLNVLLSDQPALELHVRYYQRLLTFDEHEANEIIANFLEGGTLEQLYEQMLIPTLSYSERDRNAGRLSDHQQRFIQQTLLDVIRDLGSEFDMTAAARAVPEGAAKDAEAAGTDQPIRHALNIACAPAEDLADRIAGEMLVQLLSARGHAARACEPSILDEAIVEQLQELQPGVLIVSALAPGGASRARQGGGRLRKAFPELQLVVGLWNASGPMAQTKQRLKSAKIDFVTTSLSEAIEYLEQLATDEQPDGRATPEDLADADRIDR